MAKPSSRVCTRTVCVPVVLKYTSGPSTPAPHPLSCHPQFETPHDEHSSRLTSVASAVPMRQTGDPPEVTDPENCTKAESFGQ